MEQVQCKDCVHMCEWVIADKSVPMMQPNGVQVVIRPKALVCAVTHLVVDLSTLRQCGCFGQVVR